MLHGIVVLFLLVEAVMYTVLYLCLVFFSDFQVFALITSLYSDLPNIW